MTLGVERAYIIVLEKKTKVMVGGYVCERGGREGPCFHEKCESYKYKSLLFTLMISMPCIYYRSMNSMSSYLCINYNWSINDLEQMIHLKLIMKRLFIFIFLKTIFYFVRDHHPGLCDVRVDSNSKRIVKG